MDQWARRTAVCLLCGRMDFRCNLTSGDGVPLAAEGPRAEAGFHPGCRKEVLKQFNCPLCHGTGKAQDLGRTG